MFFGPANKTEHTKMLELIAQTVLANPSAVQFTLKTAPNAKSVIMATIGGHSINLTELIQKADLTHVQLNNLDGQRYLDQHYTLIKTKGSNPKYKGLNGAEISAIYHYTGSGYLDINRFLHGKVSYSSSVKTSFIKTMMLCSAINKVPQLPSSFPIYRGESHMPQTEINQLIQLVKIQGHKQIPAFKSTSSSPSVANGFSYGSHVRITIEDWSGKDISDSSYFPSEKEILMAPEKLQWLSHQVIAGKHHFKARVVRPLDLDKEYVSPSDSVLYYSVSKACANILGLKDTPKPILNSYNQPKPALQPVNDSQNELDWWSIAEEFLEELNGFSLDAPYEAPKPKPMMVSCAA